MIHRVLGLLVFIFSLSGTLGCRLGMPPYPVSLDSPDPHQRIEAIRAAGQAMDRTAVPRLVDRLEDEDEAVRFYAILALERIEGTRLGYDYAKNDTERAATVRRWRDYVRSGRHNSQAGRTTESAPKARESQ